MDISKLNTTAINKDFLPSKKLLKLELNKIYEITAIDQYLLEQIVIPFQSTKEIIIETIAEGLTALRWSEQATVYGISAVNPTSRYSRTEF